MATFYEKVKARNKRKRKEYRQRKLKTQGSKNLGWAATGAVAGGNSLGKTIFGAATGALASQAYAENKLYRSKGWKNMTKRQAAMEKGAYRLTSARRAALRKAQKASARLRGN